MVHRKSVLAGLSLFFLLLSMYMLKALRDEAAVVAGALQLGQMISLSFAFLAGMALVIRSLRLENVIGFTLLVVLLLPGIWCSELGLFNPGLATRVIFVSLGTANLLLISVLWQVILPGFSRAEAQGAFPFIILLGVLGAIAGPVLNLAVHSNSLTILSIATATLLLSATFLRQVRKVPQPSIADQSPQASQPKKQVNYMGLLVLIYALLATVLYAEHIAVVERHQLTSAERLQFFAKRDLFIALITGLLQWWSLRQAKRKHSPKGLLWMPLLTFAVLLTIGLQASLDAVLWGLVLFRSFNYSFVRPARELYPFHRRSSLRWKTLIDTVVYRSGDLLGIWLFHSLISLGISYFYIALLLIPLLGAWLLINRNIVNTLKT